MGFSVITEINIINLIECGILIITLIILAYEIKELKKSNQAQAYQGILQNYINSIHNNDEALYKYYFAKKSVKIEDRKINLFSALINTFEMLYVQKKQKIITDDVWNVWENYFIEFLKSDDTYKEMWNELEGKKIFHEGLIKIINTKVHLK